MSEEPTGTLSESENSARPPSIERRWVTEVDFSEPQRFDYSGLVRRMGETIGQAFGISPEPTRLMASGAGFELFDEQNNRVRLVGESVNQVFQITGIERRSNETHLQLRCGDLEATLRLVGATILQGSINRYDPYMPSYSVPYRSTSSRRIELDPGPGNWSAIRSCFCPLLLDHSRGIIYGPYSQSLYNLLTPYLNHRESYMEYGVYRLRLGGRESLTSGLILAVDRWLERHFRILDYPRLKFGVGIDAGTFDSSDKLYQAAYHLRYEQNVVAGMMGHVTIDSTVVPNAAFVAMTLSTHSDYQISSHYSTIGTGTLSEIVLRYEPVMIAVRNYLRPAPTQTESISTPLPSQGTGLVRKIRR